MLGIGLTLAIILVASSLAAKDQEIQRRQHQIEERDRLIQETKDGREADNKAKQQQIDELNRQLEAKINERSRLAAILVPAAKAVSGSVIGNVGDILDRIAQCESGGNPRAISPGGTYRGAWQFDLQTWHANGGAGDPIDHSYAEQKQVAQALYARRGGSPWPVCSQR